MGVNRSLLNSNATRVRDEQAMTGRMFRGTCEDLYMPHFADRVSDKAQIVYLEESLLLNEIDATVFAPFVIATLLHALEVRSETPPALRARIQVFLESVQEQRERWRQELGEAALA